MKSRHIFAVFIIMMLVPLCVLFRKGRGAIATDSESKSAQRSEGTKRAQGTRDAAESAAIPNHPSALEHSAGNPVAVRARPPETVERSSAAERSAETAPTNIPLPKFVGGHRANVPPGGALVVGGWPLPDGHRLLMFASPQPQPDGTTAVIASRFISLPAARLNGGGWENFLTDDAVSKEGGVYSADEYRAMMKAIEAFKDIELMSAPTVVTRYGQQASIEIMQQGIEKVDGKPELTRDGLSQSIIARKVEGSSEVDLAVSSAVYDSGTKPHSENFAPGR